MQFRYLAVATLALAAVASCTLPQLRADPKPATRPDGVYFFRNGNGIWITTYSNDGRGRTDAHLFIKGEVHQDYSAFKWSMKGREIVCTRTGDPNFKLEEHNLLLDDGRIRPLRSYRDGKLLWEAPNDIGTMEFLGKEGHPMVEPQ